MTVNLIPPELKKNKRTKATLIQAYLVTISMIVILAIFSVALYVSNQFFTGDIDKTEAKIIEAEKVADKYKALETKIRQSNIKIDLLNKIDGDRILWSEVINELAVKTPPNVMIRSLTLDKDSNKINLSGIAEIRKSIAEMKEEMENSTIFQNVTFSSSSYNDQGSDFSFTLNAELEAR